MHSIEPVLRHVVCAGARRPAPGDESAATHHTMAYWEWNATGDSRHPHIILCVHGLSRQGRDFDVLARSLATSARVVCPDVVGRGHSDWLADPMEYGIPRYAGDMLTLLAALHSEARVETLDWVGTSMGGLIGMALCGHPGVEMPVPVRRLVLNDVGPAIEWSACERIGRYLGRSGTFESMEAAAAAMRAVSAGFGPHTAQQWQALSEPMVRADGAGGWRLHYDPAIAVPFAAVTEAQFGQSRDLLWNLYDAIRAETLLLRGAQSDLLSADTAIAMTRRGPRAHLVELSEVGHAPTLVAQDQVDIVCEFLLRPAVDGSSTAEPAGP